MNILRVYIWKKSQRFIVRTHVSLVFQGEKLFYFRVTDRYGDSRRDVAAGRGGVAAGTEGWWPCCFCTKVNRKWPQGLSHWLPPSRLHLLEFPQPCQTETSASGQGFKHVSQYKTFHIQTTPHNACKLLISTCRRLR